MSSFFIGMFVGIVIGIALIIYLTIFYVSGKHRELEDYDFQPLAQEQKEELRNMYEGKEK